jgi:peptide-methionine (R)-S-oxide reductase
MEKVEKTDAEWRAELTPEQYHVMRQKGTEPAFSGALYRNHADGTYRCGACGAELFSSDTKFESGSGWPSFSVPANAQAVNLHEDNSHGMTRTEVDLRTLRRPPGTRLPRWSRPWRPALLHQLVVAWF